MNRRKTYGEIRWPDDRDSRRFAVEWAESVVEQALNDVWCAFDDMVVNELDNSPDLVATHPEQLERELTQWHSIAVQRRWAKRTRGRGSVVPIHEAHELESRKGGKAMPPSYDLAFIHIGNKRWKLPIEAKLLPSATMLRLYVEDIQKKYIPGIAAPLVGECGMIGYLLAGRAGDVFKRLAATLKQPLLTVERFKDRAHKATVHARVKAPKLRIHHMVMSCIPIERGEGNAARHEGQASP